jgi:hypothetical protein
MQSIKVLSQQSIIDMAMQCYGNIDAIDELIELNPALCSDGNELDISASLLPGIVIYYNEASPLRNQSVINELTEPIITCY